VGGTSQPFAVPQLHAMKIAATLLSSVLCEDLVDYRAWLIYGRDKQCSEGSKGLTSQAFDG
jgi:hypothetical protein